MAQWVELHRKFDWVAPGGRSMKAFDPGQHYMTQDQAEEVVRQGAGKKIDKPADKKTTKAGKVVDADE